MSTDPLGGSLGQLVAMVEQGAISSSAGREVLAEMVRTGEAPAAVVERRGLRQESSSEALAPVVEEVIAAHRDKVAEYRGGRVGLMGFFVGQVMQRTAGRANPNVARDLLERQIRST